MAQQRADPSATGAAKGVIVTADDFGVAMAVNEAVERGFSEGVLTAASLMVAGAAAADAVERAKRLPGLGIGLHLVLVDGRPILPPAKVPHLVDATGQFRGDMVRAGFAFAFSPRARDELRAEIFAQFAAFAATGLTLDHVNAHRHFHLHPTVGSLILEIGAGHGLAASRLPVEPRSILRRAEPSTAPGRTLEAFWARRAHRRFRRAGVFVPDHVFGLAWSGAMGESRLAALLRLLPAGVSEIYLHPATSDRFDGAAAGYRYREELAALLSPTVRGALAQSGARAGRFADFVARGP